MMYVVIVTLTPRRTGQATITAMYMAADIQRGRARRTRQIVLSDRSMMSIIHTATTSTVAAPTQVRRLALRANSGIYSVMMVRAISGARFRRRKTLIFVITAPKKGVDASSATAMANTGVIARSDV